MLKLTKHSHPDRTAINVALLLLTRLRDRRIENYSSLAKYVRKAVSGGDVLFLPAVNFLFLMGTLRYHSKTDSFEYIGPNDNI